MAENLVMSSAPGSAKKKPATPASASARKAPKLAKIPDKKAVAAPASNAAELFLAIRSLAGSNPEVHRMCSGYFATTNLGVAYGRLDALCNHSSNEPPVHVTVRMRMICYLCYRAHVNDL